MISTSQRCPELAKNMQKLWWQQIQTSVCDRADDLLVLLARRLLDNLGGLKKTLNFRRRLMWLAVIEIDSQLLGI